MLRLVSWVVFRWKCNIKGKRVEGMEVASWSNGMLSSLYKLARQKVQVVVAMNDVKLFSVELGCARDKPHEMSRT